MVHGVARNAAVDRANATMARAARFSEDHVFVLGVADLADGGVTVFWNAANFTRGQTNLRIARVARHQRRRGTGTANDLATLAGVQLDIVNRDADRNRFERERIAKIRSRGRSAHDLRAHLQTCGSNNVGLLTVLVLKEGETRGANRSVLDRRNS